MQVRVDICFRTATPDTQVTVSYTHLKKYPIANIHVPKTIDNDLPLPKGTPTFGYESACLLYTSRCV